MKQKMVALLLLAMLLAGCGEKGLGGKAIVNAVYLDRQNGQYTADLILTRTLPSADAGEVEEESSRVSGAGESLFAALSQAEHRENREMFYGLGELLLLGQGLNGGEVLDACRFLEQQAGGRPNVEVWKLTGPEDRQVDSDETDLLRLKSLEQLKQKGVYRACLYDVAAAQIAVLPQIRFQEGFAENAGLIVWSRKGEEVRWNGPKAELAALLAGQRRDLALELENMKFRIGAPALTFEAAGTGEDLSLAVCVYGRIDDPVLRSGLRTENRQLAAEINREIERLLQELAEESFGSGRDVFRFSARLANQDAAGVRQLRAQGRLYTAHRIRFDSQLHIR